MPKLQVAYLTNQMPFPPHSGGQLREYQLLTRLRELADVHMIVSTHHYSRDMLYSPIARDFCESLTLFESESTSRPLSKVQNSLSARVSRHQSQAMVDHVTRLVSESAYDVVHFEGYFMASQFERPVDAPTVLVEENIEYLLAKDSDALSGSANEGWTTVRELERSQWNRCTVLGAVSADDVRYIGRTSGGLEARLFPNGSDHVRPEIVPPAAGSKTVVFVANYSWAPSADACSVLINEIWPMVRSEDADARLQIIGPGLEPQLAAKIACDPSIVALGQVPSIVPFVARCQVFACPTRLASGVRVKLLEALTIGCPVVCLREAVRGLPETARSAVLIADDNRSFADAILSVLQSEKLQTDLTLMGRRASLTFPTWSDAARLLMAGWEDAVNLGVAHQA